MLDGLIASSECTMKRPFKPTAEEPEEIERMIAHSRTVVEQCFGVPLERYDTLLANLNTKPAPTLKLCVLVRQ